MFTTLFLIWLATPRLTQCAAGTVETGRTVIAYSDGPTVTCKFGHDTATVKASGYAIDIAPTEIWVDQTFRLPLEKSAERVSVTVRNGTLWFAANGADIGSYKRK